MNVKDIYQHYGNSNQFHLATGFSSGNIWTWEKLGYVPLKSQYKIEKLSNGALKAAWESEDLVPQEQSVSNFKIAIPVYLRKKILEEARKEKISLILWVKNTLEEKLST